MAKPGPKGPSKQQPERLEIILKELEQHGDMETACDLAEITSRTLQNWMEKDPIISLKVRYAKAKAIRAVADEVRAKDPWKILKNIANDRYKEQIEEKVIVSYAEEVLSKRGKTPL